MPRHINFQRLNKHPKHRWSMLRNMAASLILHERITTTEAKAKVLAPLMSKIMKMASEKHQINVKKVKGILRIRHAYYKLYNDISIRFGSNSGGVTKITKRDNRRKGDNAVMATIELIKNPHLEKEESLYDQVHQQSGKNYSQWELFLRTNELKTYKAEKEKIDSVYFQLKEKIAEIKETHKGDQSNMDKIIREKMKTYLFGNKFPVHKLENDALLPQNHYIKLYFKATKSEAELDRHYKQTNSYMKYLIKSTQHQIDHLEGILRDRRQARKYEKIHFKKYYQNYSHLEKEITESVNQEEVKERHMLLQTLATIRHDYFEMNLRTAELMARLDKYARVQGYDMQNLTAEHKADLENQLLKMESEEDVQDYFAKLYEEEYMNKLSVFRLKNKEWQDLEDYKKFFVKKKLELWQTAAKGDSPIKYDHFLSQEELAIKDLKKLRSLVDQEEIEQVKENQLIEQNEKDLLKKREKYELMLRRYFDRQVKKKKKVDYRDLIDERANIERPDDIEGDKRPVQTLH